MFTIVISEKGGAERRETFDKNEVNFGRLQGNDLMLPKGNVSKHHARLLYRDGRFIVTDLRSTNGTYVNGRKISQATIVREGDKIYVGDFVLRLETGQRTPRTPPRGPWKRRPVWRPTRRLRWRRQRSESRCRLRCRCPRWSHKQAPRAPPWRRGCRRRRVSRSPTRHLRSCSIAGMRRA